MLQKKPDYFVVGGCEVVIAMYNARPLSRRGGAEQRLHEVSFLRKEEEISYSAF